MGERNQSSHYNFHALNIMRSWIHLKKYLKGSELLQNFCGETDVVASFQKTFCLCLCHCVGSCQLLERELPPIIWHKASDKILSSVRLFQRFLQIAEPFRSPSDCPAVWKGSERFRCYRNRQTHCLTNYEQNFPRLFRLNFSSASIWNFDSTLPPPPSIRTKSMPGSNILLKTMNIISSTYCNLGFISSMLGYKLDGFR